MPRQVITTANAPSSPLYSQAVKAGPHLIISGVVGINPGTGTLAAGSSQAVGDRFAEESIQSAANAWTGDELSLRDRSLIVIAADMASPGSRGLGGLAIGCQA